MCMCHPCLHVHLVYAARDSKNLKVFIVQMSIQFTDKMRLLSPTLPRPGSQVWIVFEWSDKTHYKWPVGTRPAQSTGSYVVFTVFT